jgi:hypothetical protein
LCLVIIMSIDVYSDDFDFKEYCKVNGITLKKKGLVMVFPVRVHTIHCPLNEKK